MAISLWKRITTNELPTSRIERMELASVLNWYETTIMELGSAFDKYRYHNDDYSELDKIFGILQDLHAEIGARGKRD